MGDGSLGAATLSDIGTLMQSLDRGDFDADGNLDLVVGDGTGSVLTLLKGNGDGTFTAAQSFSAANGALGTQFVDVNLDGRLDIVGTGSSEVGIFLNQGDGTFQSSGSVSLRAAALYLASGDVNGDSIVDLIATSASGVAEVLLGDGAGSFFSVSTFSAPGVGLYAAIGDLNNDGFGDFVAIDEAASSVHLSNGDGTFGSGVALTTPSIPTDIDLADLNGDGNLDVIISDKDTGEISSFLGDGAGSFGDTFVINTDTRLSEVGDFNGDGILDVASVGGSGAVVALGNGDGSFGSVSTVVAGTSGKIATGLVSGDFNNDGVLDISTTFTDASQNFTTVLGNTREGIAPLLELSLETQAGALQALAPLERKLASLSTQRGTIGAFQSRLQSALATLGSTSENYSAAESRIRDADIAFESSQLTRLNILQQAAASVLGQANLQPRLALDLLS